jgi:hypothetical protein
MKKVKLLVTESIPFNIGDRTVYTNATLSVSDAEVIAGQYPGVYVEVIEDVKPGKNAGIEKTEG